MLNLNVLKYIFYHSLCRGVAMYAIVGMWSHTFMEIGHEIISVVILLQ